MNFNLIVSLVCYIGAAIYATFSQDSLGTLWILVIAMSFSMAATQQDLRAAEHKIRILKRKVKNLERRSN